MHTRVVSDRTHDDQNTRSVPWRWVLPIAQLLICVVALFPALPLFYFQLKTGEEIPREYLEWRFGHRGDVDGRGSAAPELHFNFDLSPEATRKRPFSMAMFREQIPIALDLAGMVFELPEAILSKHHSSWVPRGMMFYEWRELSYPLTSTVFWFVVGRAAEALSSLLKRKLQPRLRWWDGLIMLPPLVIGGLLIALVVSEPQHVNFSGSLSPEMDHAVSFGSVFWFALGCFVYFVFVLQARARRRLRRMEESNLRPV